MNVLINLSTLKNGGGQNVAMNFLHSVFDMKLKDIELFYIVAKDSEPHIFLSALGSPNYVVVPRNPVSRIVFELFRSPAILRARHIDIIYSYFGIGVYSKKVAQVTGSADSNLYFPEIDFWSDYSGIARLKKKIVDLYRIWGVKRSQAVVFENEALEARSRELFQLKKTKLIKPSINFNFPSRQFKLPAGVVGGAPKGLFLCGWQPNKNYEIIPELAAELKKRGVKFSFLITAPLDKSARHKEFVASIAEKNVEDMVTIIGQVKKDELASLYEQVSCVFLLSRLESFSNNIIESWHFKRPLIVTDAAWSRSICGDAALYVDRNSVSDIVRTIIAVDSDAGLRRETIARGTAKLDEYPSIETRINQELEFLRDVYNNN